MTTHVCNFTATSRRFSYTRIAYSRAIDRGVSVVADKGPQLRPEREKWESSRPRLTHYPSRPAALPAGHVGLKFK